MSELPTPREVAMQNLGYIPEGTPETWEEVEAIAARRGVNLEYMKHNSYGSALDGTPPANPVIAEAWKERE